MHKKLPINCSSETRCYEAHSCSFGQNKNPFGMYTRSYRLFELLTKKLKQKKCEKRKTFQVTV